MTRIHVHEEAVIDAPASEIYALLADYRDGHPHILPRQYFTGLDVEQGGVGAGTIINAHMRVMGIEQHHHMIVGEPEPGHVLSETAPASDMTTTFTVTPQGDQQASVVIATTWPQKPGLGGIIDKLTTPLIMRRIYRKELQQLAGYLQEQRAQNK
jgi:hypothetical protein